MTPHGPTFATFENATVVLGVMEKWGHWLSSFRSDAHCHLDSEYGILVPVHTGTVALLLILFLGSSYLLNSLNL